MKLTTAFLGVQLLLVGTSSAWEVHVQWCRPLPAPATTKGVAEIFAGKHGAISTADIDDFKNECLTLEEAPTWENGVDMTKETSYVGWDPYKYELSRQDQRRQLTVFESPRCIRGGFADKEKNRWTIVKGEKEPLVEGNKFRVRAYRVTVKQKKDKKKKKKAGEKNKKAAGGGRLGSKGGL
jgi:hypothetical protein